MPHHADAESCPEPAGSLDPIVLSRAMALVRTSEWVMTSLFERRRAAAMVSGVLRSGDDPPLVCVAMRKGHPIEPIIRDSRAFALCAVGSDRVLARAFGQSSDKAAEALEALPCGVLRTGTPSPTRAVAVFDCLLHRHVDIESDHELYVGLVVGVRAQ